jgi:acyl carrier protein/NAD(P)-dependent dehydrogenase (short-subunit alcohol dehydrogenase family)
MVDLRSDAKPAPAALVTGVSTPEGQSIATSLARAGYRVCLLVAGKGALEPSALPGHDRLKHEAVDIDSFDAASLTRAAQRAEHLLGHVTALVHVALPAAALPGAASSAALSPAALSPAALSPAALSPAALSPAALSPAALSPSLAEAADALESAAFASELAAQAGAFLALGLALLPGMFGTQTGALCLLTAKGSSDAAGSDAAGRGALLGAALGAVRELADRTAGTPLRSIALYTEGPRGALAPAALAMLNAQLGFEAVPGLIESGWFSSLAAPAIQGPIEFLRPPPVPAAGAAPLVAPVSAPSPAAPGCDRVAVQLAQTFRAAFGLAPNADVSNLAVGNVEKWDSLGHLKLMMEVEQVLRVRVPSDALPYIRSFKDLEKVVRANLPVR